MNLNTNRYQKKVDREEDNIEKVQTFCALLSYQVEVCYLVLS